MATFLEIVQATDHNFREHAENTGGVETHSSQSKHLIDAGVCQAASERNAPLEWNGWQQRVEATERKPMGGSNGKETNGGKQIGKLISEEFL